MFSLATVVRTHESARRWDAFLLKIPIVSSVAPETSYLGSYQDLVQAFLQKGYVVRDFHSSASASGELILRHDVDFDCQAAQVIAMQEAQISVQSTFFFLLRSASYNLLEPKNSDSVKAIRDLGHEVSVHYDPTLYESDAPGLLDECALFERIFDVKVRIVSFHRPSPAFQQLTEPFHGIAHTYQPKFTKDICYLSDSQGAFRYGHPHASEAFQAGRSVQLLTHPIWWALPGSGAIGVLENLLSARALEARQHVGKNCIPFQKHLEQS
jgi:hypothetical protein